MNKNTDEIYKIKHTLQKVLNINLRKFRILRSFYKEKYAFIGIKGYIRTKISTYQLI